MNLIYKVYNKLKIVQSDGAIIPDLVFDVIQTELLNALEEEHAADYMGTDDDMPDNFAAWLGDKCESDPLLETILN